MTVAGPAFTPPLRCRYLRLSIGDTANRHTTSSGGMGVGDSSGGGGGGGGGGTGKPCARVGTYQIKEIYYPHVNKQQLVRYNNSAAVVLQVLSYSTDIQPGQTSGATYGAGLQPKKHVDYLVDHAGCLSARLNYDITIKRGLCSRSEHAGSTQPAP